MGVIHVLMFVAFVVMLVGLLLLHHHKIIVVVIGFTTLTGLFLSNHSLGELCHHFAEPHRSHLLINLAFILPGFAGVAFYFERSGMARTLAQSKRMKSDAALLW